MYLLLTPNLVPEYVMVHIVKCFLTVYETCKHCYISCLTLHFG